MPRITGSFSRQEFVRSSHQIVWNSVNPVRKMLHHFFKFNLQPLQNHARGHSQMQFVIFKRMWLFLFNCRNLLDFAVAQFAVEYQQVVKRANIIDSDQNRGFFRIPRISLVAA